MNRATFWSLWIGGAAIAFGVGRLVGAATAPATPASGQQSALVAAAASGSTNPANTSLSNGASVASVESGSAAFEAAEAASRPSEPTKPTLEPPAVNKAPPAEAKSAAPAGGSSEPIDRSVFGLPTETGVTEGPPPAVAGPMPLPKAPAGWLPSPARGDDDPLVVVLVSSDFQCPVCRRVVLPTEQLIRDLPDDVRVEFKHHALSSHARAEPAALASMAAHKQGRFWDYHDLLFGNFGRLADSDLEQFAQDLKLDMEQFKADRNDPALKAQIAHEGAAADKQGARGTPGFFINGKKQVGWGSYFGFKSMVDRELQKAKALEAEGKTRDEIRRIRAAENAEIGADFVKHFLDGEPD